MKIKMIDNSSNSIDQELARVAEESLTLGEHHVTKILAPDRVRPPRQNYAQLYQASSLPPPPTAASLGPVPGFPDFPVCWQGFEGGLSVEHNKQRKDNPMGQQQQQQQQQQPSRGFFCQQNIPSLLSHTRNNNPNPKQTVVARRKTRIWKRQAVNPQACRRRPPYKSRFVYRNGKFVNNPQRALSVMSYELAQLQIQPHKED